MPKRLVVEHPETGLRLAVDEAAFDDPEANPLNHDHVDYRMGLGGATESTHAGRTGADRKSLKAEGYKPVAYQDEQSQETPLPKGYRWKAKKA